MTVQNQGIKWREAYEGGSAEAERLTFDKLARDIMAVQLKIQRRAKQANVQRAFHAKAVFAANEADLRFVDDLPEDLCAASRSQEKPTTASNAGSPASSPDDPETKCAVAGAHKVRDR
jgi:hypothetical protein